MAAGFSSADDPGEREKERKKRESQIRESFRFAIL